MKPCFSQQPIIIKKKTSSSSIKREILRSTKKIRNRDVKFFSQSPHEPIISGEKTHLRVYLVRLYMFH